jgi:nicotinamide mononucleotide transporter
MQNVEAWLAQFHLDIIQLIVLMLGVSEVLLARVNNVWLYPAGIAGTTLSIYSLFNVQLYAECILQVYYIVMSFYGWWYWVGKRYRKPIDITFTTKNEWFITMFIIIGGWLFLYFFLIGFTPSQVPAWDAWISATGWAGMWLLARRKVENWLILNVSNVFAIPLLIYKDLPLYAVLTAFLFLVACFGYRDWFKLAKQKTVLSQY